MTAPNPNPMLDVAIRYRRRGWSVVPIPFRSKNPGFDEWQLLRLNEPDLPKHFNGHRQNIGVLLGEPSHHLADVDLDHSLALKIADELLPSTPAVFGRPSKPRSHRLYITTSLVDTRQYRDSKKKTIIELRSTGAQTVFPPSVHPSGELITWEVPNAEPAVVNTEVLVRAVEQIAQHVREQIGDCTPASRAAASQPSNLIDEANADPCLRAMLLMKLTDNNDGSFRLFSAACRTVEHDLDDSQAVACIRVYEKIQPFPRQWSDDDILKRVRDAEKECTRGKALEHHTGAQGLIALGERDPESGKLVLSPKRTLPTAMAYVRQFHHHPDARTLYSYAGVLMRWHCNRYCQVEDEAVRNRLLKWLHSALRYVFSKRTGEFELLPFDANPNTVNHALDTLRAYTHLPVSTLAPCWLDGVAGRLPACEILPCKSLNVHIPTGAVLPATPALFTINALDFDYDAQPEVPELWIKFLEQLWGDDLESVELLQDWFGYCLTADTSQQKMLLMVGPRRSGKGTIGRIATRLVGAANVVGPTISSLAGLFGLQPLIDKSLAIVSDARFAGDHIGTVIERLLCISGEDTLTIDRKHLPSVTMRLPTRFMFLTNELPRLSDASTALAGRFMVLRLTRSFYGKEDLQLTERLLIELPGILHWAIGGWKRLRERGHFLQPATAVDAIRDMEDLASPVSAFVRDCCIVGPGHRVCVDDLYSAWKSWCEQDGRTGVSHKQTFGRDLAAAVPGVIRRRGTGMVPFYEGIALREATP